MEREQIIKELGEYFHVANLVCDHIFTKHGEGSWKFLRTEALYTLLVIRRDILKVPMFVNYGVKHQRGVRCNLCDIVQDKSKRGILYLSGHVLAGAFDFDAKDYTAEEARQKIRDNKDKLPYSIRLERGVTWIHVDTIDECNGNKINEFNP